MAIHDAANSPSRHTKLFTELFHGDPAGGVQGSNLLWIALMKFHEYMDPVRRLLFRRGPPTIPRLVIPVIIDSLKREAGWIHPHIRNKIAKVHPPSAYRNATSAVSVPIAIGFVKTSALHIPPCLING